MRSVHRSATAIWEGDLARGRGLVDRDSSTAPPEPVTWDSRVADGVATNPEELIAAAHAGCFSMAIASVLGEQGRPPQHLEVRADCRLDVGALRITTITLFVRGQVPGLEPATFAEAVRRAEAICPVSNALRGNVEIAVRAELDVA